MLEKDLTNNVLKKQLYVLDVGATKVDILGVGEDAFYFRYKLPCTNSINNDLADLSDKLAVITKDNATVIISFPGLLQDGVILSWPNKPYWNGYNILDFFKKIFKSSSIFIDDDANLALHYWRYFNDFSGKDMFYINAGTGIGMGIYLGNDIYKGSNGFAGEFGHVCVDMRSKIKCPCGQHGCLQLFSSGKGMLHRYMALPDAKLACLDFKELNDSVELNTFARNIITFGAELLAQQIMNLVILFDITLIFISGSLCLSKLFSQVCLKSINSHPQASVRKVKVIMNGSINASLLGGLVYGCESIQPNDKKYIKDIVTVSQRMIGRV